MTNLVSNSLLVACIMTLI